MVVTLDADFHSLLVLSGDSGPSVVRLRVEGMKAEALAGLLVHVLRDTSTDLDAGAVVSATRKLVRVKRLPVR